MAWDTEIEYLKSVPEKVQDYTGTRKGHIEALRISHRVLYKMHPEDRWHSEYHWETKCHRCGKTHNEDGTPYTVRSRCFYEDATQISCGCHNRDERAENGVTNIDEFNRTRPNAGIKALCKKVGVPYPTYYGRRQRGLSHEEALQKIKSELEGPK